VSAVVLRGDARRLPLPDACVDLIVTSPPYFGLRSYTDGGGHYDGQIGSEATPREWLAALLACTREWVRVLKPSGSLFVNLGDKYSTSMHSYNYRDPGTYTRKTPQPDGEWSKSGWHGKPNVQPTAQEPGMAPKSLMGLPWRYALACTDELGLILRRDIIWSKPNGLPESVTDRCRSSHEYVFHLVRSPRYYAAVDEIREPTPEIGRKAKSMKAGPLIGNHGSAGQDGNGMRLAEVYNNPLGKLPGSVWDIPSQPLTVPAHLGVDHFAAFPTELPRRVILGWSPPGICTECGEGRRPVTRKEHFVLDTAADRWATELHTTTRGLTAARGRRRAERDITGYACACPQPDAPVRPALVVDPFGGTGTTALVAAAYGRVGVSVDLSGDYCRLARWRTADPAERARALCVPKPPPVPDGQASLFDLEVS
jgi:DNA modification methylase